MSALRFEHVSVRYGSHRSGLTAVDDATLTVPSGSVVGLVGESGSGKSTLARAAIGLAPISEGAITLDGADVRSFRRRRPIQMVFQDPFSSLDPRMTIGESIAEALPRDLRGGRARRAEVARLLDLVSLDADRAEALPAALSGGQRQRIALARALAARPEVVIADEITSALDVSVQGSVLNLVRELRAELDLTMLFISHNLSVVRYLSDHIAVMYLGRIVEVGPTARVLADPQHPYTRELLQAAPTRHGDLLAVDPVAPVAVEPADPHAPPSGCRFHPRCPIGPVARPDRQICVLSEPMRPTGPVGAACHFAGSVPPPQSAVLLSVTATTPPATAADTLN
ncbi:oligopeptide transporter subunit; ATP-binding component of ABC superfamily [Microbacterium sp. Nx66]|uniref:ABC transporter ATP-binding protein n=1 Tax=unclassified Microbacterium TaxID=2609290 RepID=UPI001657324F|nr:oligopeptide/dipeptide ABC transporter ATP-binding protein [Microbacterium sp. Nx66]CAD5140305.1 oligopeptide transporter subunit; ATP-binding component of ABC superfamily [Microbacterium sp. Nx66]